MQGRTVLIGVAGYYRPNGFPVTEPTASKQGLYGAI